MLFEEWHKFELSKELFKISKDLLRYFRSTKNATAVTDVDLQMGEKDLKKNSKN